MTQAEQAYHALRIAAERIGRNNHAAGLYRVRRNRAGRVVDGYRLTQEHAALVEAMPRVLSGEITPSEAMALLHDYDTMKQRLGAA